MRQLNNALLKKHIESLGKRGMEKLAVKADLSGSTIEKMLAGTYNNPTLETISKLCEATGIKFERLFPLVEEEAA